MNVALNVIIIVQYEVHVWNSFINWTMSFENNATNEINKDITNSYNLQGCI